MPLSSAIGNLTNGDDDEVSVAVIARRRLKSGSSRLRSRPVTQMRRRSAGRAGLIKRSQPSATIINNGVCQSALMSSVRSRLVLFIITLRLLLIDHLGQFREL